MLTLLVAAFFVALVGLAVGSFLNVVIFRTETGETMMGRSKCQKCEEPIAIVDLIPVLSFFLLKGRCRRCSETIEWQYPAVEIAMACLYGLMFARALFLFGVPSFVDPNEWVILFARDSIMATIMLIIFVYDLRYSYILDRFTVPGMILALVFNVALGADPLNLLLGGLAIGSFFAAQYLLSGGRWIGGGDIRLGMLMGFYLGLEQGLVALFLAYLFGAVIGVVLILTKKRKIDGQVPFGTFLAGATIITSIWGQDILGWYLGFLK